MKTVINLRKLIEITNDTHHFDVEAVNELILQILRIWFEIGSVPHNRNGILDRYGGFTAKTHFQLLDDVLAKKF